MRRQQLTFITTILSALVASILIYFVFLSELYNSSDNSNPLMFKALITNLVIQESAVDTPTELNEDAWKSVVLPDDWFHSQREALQHWYRVNLIYIPKAETVWAVYVPTVSHNVAVYINDIWIGQSGSFEPKISRHANQPLLFEFSSSLLIEGTNQIELRVAAAHAEQGLLDVVYIAPKEIVYSDYLTKRVIRYDLLNATTMFMFFFAFVLFIFWSQRRHDTLYGVFALTLSAWGTYNLYWLMPIAPIPNMYWESLNILMFAWTVIGLVLSNHRFTGYGSKSLEKVLLIYGALGLLLFCLPNEESVFWWGYKVWMPFTIPLGLYACFHLIRAFQVTGNLEILLMPCAGVAIIIAGFHDVLIMNHLWDRTDGMYSQFNTILVGMFFSLLLLNRFARSLQQAEDLSLTLEQRIQTKTLELQGQYKQLNVLENEKILSEERERIMRDMHDGMGGQLISISTILHGHHGEIFQQIRDKIRISLADFRLVIDSLDPLLNDLPTLLGMMRSRLTEQLKAENITLEWAVTDLPELNNMSPRRSLHIMRIVQESITNSIKHAHTQRMKLSTYVEGSHSRYIVIKIQDFGPGLNEENLTLTQGRGIKNMYYRADQIGARFEIASFKERDNVMGTSVILKLPL